MNKCLIFAIVACAAVVCISAKPNYAPGFHYSSAIYARPAITYNSASASAAASVASSSVARPSYVYHVPSYVIDGGYSGYSIYDPRYINSYNDAY